MSLDKGISGERSLPSVILGLIARKQNSRIAVIYSRAAAQLRSEECGRARAGAGDGRRLLPRFPSSPERTQTRHGRQSRNQGKERRYVVDNQAHYCPAQLSSAQLSSARYREESEEQGGCPVCHSLVHGSFYDEKKSTRAEMLGKAAPRSLDTFTCSK